MIKLRKFESHSQYEAFTATTEFIKPNVSLCSNENEVHYNPIPPQSERYLTFIVIKTTRFKFIGNAVQYSLDEGKTWTDLASNTNTPSLSPGVKIMWRATGLTPNSSRGIGKFSAYTGSQFDVEGNPMSLLYGDNFKNQTSLSGKNYAFKGLFSGNTKVVSAKNISLPATTLASYCYDSMFYGCTSLTTAPELPATTLANYCYQYMFQGCTALTTAPSILPATTLVNSCYTQMFYNCTNLNSITCLATDISASGTANWVYGVAASGTFKKAASMTSWTTGVSGIPNGWTVQDA